MTKIQLLEEIAKSELIINTFKDIAKGNDGDNIISQLKNNVLDFKLRLLEL